MGRRKKVVSKGAFVSADCLFVQALSANGSYLWLTILTQYLYINEPRCSEHWGPLPTSSTLDELLLLLLHPIPGCSRSLFGSKDKSGLRKKNRQKRFSRFSAPQLSPSVLFFSLFFRRLPCSQTLTRNYHKAH